MGIIAVEVYQSVFADLVRLIVTMAPMPIPAVSALGADRLIHDIVWKLNPEVGASGGPPVPAQTLMVRAEVDIAHLSVAELQASASAAPTVTPAVAWLNVSVDGDAVRVDLVAVDVRRPKPGQVDPVTVRQSFDPPVLVGVRSTEIGNSAPENPITKGALFLSGDVVTMRFGGPGDSLGGPAHNRLLQHNGSNWLIHVASDVLIGVVRKALVDSLGGLKDSPDYEIHVEDSPDLAWTKQDGQWGVTASLGIVIVDVCPTVFGKVDFSVDLGLRLDIARNDPPPDQPKLPPTHLVLRLHLTHNTSDWDAFRCWAGTFGTLAVAAAIGSPAAGIIVGGLSLVAVAGAIAIVGKQMVVDEAGSTDPGQGLAPVVPPDIDDDVTYAGTQPLPALPGRIDNATVSASGITVFGDIVLAAAEHKRSGPTLLKPDWYGGYDCGKQAWAPELKVPSFSFKDRVSIKDVLDADLPVKLFDTIVASPTGLWKVVAIEGIPPEIRLEPKGVPTAGLASHVIVHSTAGLRRVDIAPIPAAPPTPSALELSVMEAKCHQWTPIWTGGAFDIQWLVDPPPDFGFGHEAVRQWLITIATIAKGSTIEIETVTAAARTKSLTLVAPREGSAFVELCTPRSATITAHYSGVAEAHVRLAQRWLLPRAVYKLPAGPTGLVQLSRRSVGVVIGDEVLEYDVADGPLKKLSARVARAMRAERDERSGRVGNRVSRTVAGWVVAIDGRRLLVAKPWDMRSAPKRTSR